MNTTSLITRFRAVIYTEDGSKILGRWRDDLGEAYADVNLLRVPHSCPEVEAKLFPTLLLNHPTMKGVPIVYDGEQLA